MRPLRVLRAFLSRAYGVAFLVRAMLQTSAEVGGIEIRGRRDFCEQVAEALRLLHVRSPAAFALCQRHFDLIIMSRHSGVDVRSRPGIVMVGDWTKVSTRYLASGLAHEALHCSLYWSCRDQDPKRAVPSAVFSGRIAEGKCLEYQISVLKDLGETDENASRLRDLMNTEWWNVPWEERNW